MRILTGHGKRLCSHLPNYSYNMNSMNYVCSKCGQQSKLAQGDQAGGFLPIDLEQDVLPYDHQIGLGHKVMVCPNCNDIHLAVSLNKADGKPEKLKIGAELESWQLMPSSNAQKQPSYIPKAVVNDYEEAYQVLESSPRASASFARRALQKMIRNFHNAKDENLLLELQSLEPLVTADEWQALKGLMAKGKTADHMKQDTNQIVEIDDGEAERLIAVVEYLFEQWYVRRKDSQDSLKKLQADVGLRKAARKK